MRAVWSLRLVVIAALAGSLAGLAPAPAGAALGPCKPTSATRLCGRVTVPLDRSGVVPGTIGLRVRALAPVAGAPTGVVLALAGGPGQAAAPLLDQFAAALGPARRTRELVTFDQRGTGDSGRLACAALSHGEGSTAIGRCATELGAARAAYTTAASVEDIEAVRADLGVDRLILYGTSYGTKVALDYAATYPEHVEGLVLDSVVLPGGVDPFDRTTVGSIRRVLRTLCAHACGFTRDPYADLVTLARRLPRRVPVGHGRHATLTPALLFELLLDGDFDRSLRAAFPSAVRSWLDGDFAPLLRLVSNDGGGGLDAGTDSDATFVATTCEDGGVPWAPGTPLADRRAAVNAAAAAIPDAAFAPFDRPTVRRVGTADLCRAWPESPIAQPRPALPATPALILSGDDDLRTPRADALALAAQLPGAQLLEVPGAGHSVLFSDPTDCATKAVVAFLDGLVPGACRPHPAIIPPFPLAPRRLGALRPAHGLHGRVGRTATAMLRTLEDATNQLVELLDQGSSRRRFAGLRDGDAVVAKAGLRLRAYSYVPGVTVSGLLSARARRIKLRIGGAAAARGVLVIDKHGVTGTLGGTPVDVPASKLNASRAAAASAAVLRALPAGPRPALRLPFWRGAGGAR